MPTEAPPSRRTILGCIGAGVAAAATGGVSTSALAQAANPNLPPYKPALDQQFKLTQAVAKYQDTPHGNDVCGTCPYFIVPSSCVVVDGTISPTGWCPIYTTFSPEDRGAHT